MRNVPSFFRTVVLEISGLSYFIEVFISCRSLLRAHVARDVVNQSITYTVTIKTHILSLLFFSIKMKLLDKHKYCQTKNNF